VNTADDRTHWLRLEGVDVTLRGRAILKSIDLAAAPGEHIVVVGPNGAGKTTLLRAIAGLLPCRGNVLVGGRDVASLTRGERARLISYLPQGHSIHWPISVRELVGIGRMPHGDARLALSAEDEAAVERAIAAADIGDLAERTATRLSGGETARVALARALAVEAPVLLADEPMAALDPRYRLMMMELLRATAHAGMVVLTVVHDLALAARYGDRIIVLDGGELAADGLPQLVLDDQLLADVFGIRVHRGSHDGEPFLVPLRSI
jgi:iron complex transport system ATP-binding protein